MNKLVLMKYLDAKGIPRYKRITENEVHGTDEFRKEFMDLEKEEMLYLGEMKELLWIKSLDEEEAFRQIYEMLDNYTIHPILYEWSMQMLKKIHEQELEERYDRADMQHASLEECEKERSKLLDMSLRGMIDDDTFETKDRQLRERIEKIKQVSKDAQERNKNWYEIVGRTLETLRSSPKEKMEAATSAGERRAILQAIGPVAKLVERKVGTDQNGGDLTAKFIEVEPYPWLEKLEKYAKKITPEIVRVFNSNLQGKNDEKSALYSFWWVMRGSNPRPSRCKRDALAN